MRTTSEREEPLRASAPIAIHLPPSLPLPLRFRRRPLDGSRVQISLSKYNPSRFDGERVCPERARAAFHYAAGQVPLSSPLPSSGSLAAASLGLSSSRGRADGLPFRKAGEREKEREGGPGRERQGTGEKANEAEVRNVGGERAAKSDGRVGSGGDGRKWQQQQVRRRRGRRVDT